MLYIEMDIPQPVIDEMIPLLSHKQPKIIAATISALTSIYHAYGCKTVDPKPLIKLLPKMFAHADKNVRAEAQNLTVEFYRWIKEDMKKLFWNDLKPVQQTDLQKLFDKVAAEPPPKQERLLRSQQDFEEEVPEAAADAAEGDEDEEEGGFDMEPERVEVDVFAKMPTDLNERLASSKWKDRKEVLEEVQAAIDKPAIQEGPFDDLIRGCAKSMKDANIAVVTIAAKCVELLAKGLLTKFAKYRSSILSPMLERFKEKKQSVTDGLAAACDAVFASTNLTDNLEEILEFMKHKNPLVKLETTRFLKRCLSTTRVVPQAPEVKSMVDAATKLLTESQEGPRTAGAEVLGVLLKIMGDRNMQPHLEPLDDIRKTKIKEFSDQAEVKAKWKPKAAPPPKPAAAPAAKKPTLGKRPAGTVKKAAPRPVTPEEPAATAPLAARPTSRPGVKAAPKTGLQPPNALKKKPGLAAPGSSISSPRRTPAPAAEEPVAAIPPPRSGLAAPGRSLAARPLGRPAAFDQSTSEYAEPAPAPQMHTSTLSNAERAELSDLRAEVEYLRQQNSDLRTDKLKLQSQIHELQNSNAQLIEDHTRDVLGIKAKETQLVRSRSDAEAAEERAASLSREVDRLKREVVRLGRQERENAEANYADNNGGGGMNGGMNGSGGSRYDNNNSNSNGTYNRPTYSGSKSYQIPNSNFSRDRDGSSTEGKENIPELDEPLVQEPPASIRRKLSPSFAAAAPAPSRAPSNTPSIDHVSSGRASPALGGGVHMASMGSGEGRSSVSRSQSDGVESWRRAAEVTQNLKARIEMMKVCFLFAFLRFAGLVLMILFRLSSRACRGRIEREGTVGQL